MENEYFVEDAKVETRPDGDLIIPEYYHQFYLNKCKCGAKMKVTVTLSRYFCSNQECPETYLPIYLENMLSNLGVKGTGPAFCVEYMKHTPVPSHVCILADDTFRVPLKIRYQIKQSLLIPRTYATVLQKLALPGLSKELLRIFDDIPNYEIYRDRLLEAKSMEMFLFKIYNRVGKSTDYIGKTLTKFDAEMSFASHVFTLKTKGKIPFPIVITNPITKVPNIPNRESFVDLLQREGKGWFEFKSCKARTTVQYIITDTDHNFSDTSSEEYTDSFEAGKKRGVLVYSDIFLELVKERVKELEEELRDNEDREISE